MLKQFLVFDGDRFQARRDLRPSTPTPVPKDFQDEDGKPGAPSPRLAALSTLTATLRAVEAFTG